MQSSVHRQCTASLSSCQVYFTSFLARLGARGRGTRARRPSASQGVALRFAHREGAGRVKDFEKLGAFYLGRVVDPKTGAPTDDILLYDSRDLTTHAVCV